MNAHVLDPRPAGRPRAIGSRARASVKAGGKRVLLKTLELLTGRHPVLLPSEARSEHSLLRLRAPYRVEEGVLKVELEDPGPGRLSAELLGYVGHSPTRRMWRGEPREYDGPCELTLCLTDGRVELAGQSWGRVPELVNGRRFCWKLRLTNDGGAPRERLTGHYVAAEGRILDASYFRGDNYVDHEAQSQADHSVIGGLLRAHAARSPILEVGCATGGLISRLESMGLEALGLDASPWAVRQAQARLGPGRVFLGDPESDPIPLEILARAPFRCLVLWAVLEHFREPFSVLERLTSLVDRGALLVLNTTNQESLTHLIFGSQWEGHYDWTHLGVRSLGARSLREELPKLGWRVERLTTDRVWDGAADPTRATLRDWWDADARFRRLLVERELGDLITCLAVKE